MRGCWRRLAYWTVTTYKDQPVPDLTLWLGGRDLPKDANSEGFTVSIWHGDELLAHSRKAEGIIRPGHFQRTRVLLYRPHTEKASPNALRLTMQDLGRDGRYQVRVTRRSDEQVIRPYTFEVVDGSVQGLSRSKPGYEPATDYILPRVLKKGTTGLEMTEAIWIQRRQ